MTAPVLSIVVTAPHGLKDCTYLADVKRAGAMCSFEIIVPDGSPVYSDGSHDNVRHIHCPGRSLQGLLTEAIRVAKGKWILVTEDHCRPDPAVVRHYLAMIGRHPDVSLMSGAVDNLTSTSIWSTATYLIGLSAFSPHAGCSPGNATNANMMIRKDAILQSELASDGGVLNATVPRLLLSDGYRHCPEALVDHIVRLKARDTVGFISHCTLEWEEEHRKFYRHAGYSLRSLLGGLHRAAGHIIYVPKRVKTHFRGGKHPDFKVMICVRLICAGLAAVALFYELRRLFDRLASRSVYSYPSD